MNKENQLLSEKIDKGVKKAISEAIEIHRKLGESIAIWQDGKVVTLTSNQIPKFSYDFTFKDEPVQE